MFEVVRIGLPRANILSKVFLLVLIICVEGIAGGVDETDSIFGLCGTLVR